MSRSTVSTSRSDTAAAFEIPGQAGVRLTELGWFQPRIAHTGRVWAGSVTVLLPVLCYG